MTRYYVDVNGDTWTYVYDVDGEALFVRNTQDGRTLTETELSDTHGPLREVPDRVIDRQGDEWVFFPIFGRYNLKGQPVSGNTGHSPIRLEDEWGPLVKVRDRNPITVGSTVRFIPDEFEVVEGFDGERIKIQNGNDVRWVVPEDLVTVAPPKPKIGEVWLDDEDVAFLVAKWIPSSQQVKLVNSLGFIENLTLEQLNQKGWRRIH